MRLALLAGMFYRRKVITLTRPRKGLLGGGLLLTLIMSQNRLVAKHYWLNPEPWCKPSESTKRSAREHYAAHVASTACQITGAALSLIRSFPRLNGAFLNRWVSSMPATVIEAHRKRFNPSIGPKQSLIVRWSCSNRLISGVCRRDTQIRVSWSLGIKFRIAAVRRIALCWFHNLSYANLSPNVLSNT